MRRTTLRILPLLVVVLFLMACGSSAPTPAPTVDTDTIVRSVVSELQNQATAVPTVDTTAVTEAVLDAIQPELDRPTPTAVPTVNTDGITQAVLNEVDSRTALALAGVDTENLLIDLYARANPSVVYIIIPNVGSGSGFVYNTDGYIVTNNHVVENGDTYEVVFASGERRPADLVGTDVDSDLAVIKVDALPDGVQPLPLADADEVQVGQFVVAIGNPFGEQGSMSFGIVSGLGRSLRSQRGLITGDAYSLPEVVQTDAPINPGNSGGPLLNLDGEVIGVNSSIATLTGTNSGVGFSIPVAAVRRIVPVLIEDGHYVYPYMGAGFADDLTLADWEEIGLSQSRGAYLLSVTNGSPADEAGLIPASSSTGRGGDLIIQIDDQAIDDFSDLNSYLVFHTSVGQTIQLTVLRDGEQVVLPLTLGARP
jgi:2-alkenal reductase